MCRTICAALLIPLLAAAQSASTPDPWEGVERIATGERIQIQLHDYSALAGWLTTPLPMPCMSSVDERLLRYVARTCESCTAGKPDTAACGR